MHHGITHSNRQQHRTSQRNDDKNSRVTSLSDTDDGRGAVLCCYQARQDNLNPLSSAMKYGQAPEKKLSGVFMWQINASEFGKKVLDRQNGRRGCGSKASKNLMLGYRFSRDTTFRRHSSKPSLANQSHYLASPCPVPSIQPELELSTLCLERAAGLFVYTAHRGEGEAPVVCIRCKSCCALACMDVRSHWQLRTRS